MTTIKSYTDLSQSKKLAEILPLKSADMRYEAYYVSPKDGIIEYEKHPHFAKCIENCISCWSLDALLNLIPDSIYENTDDFAQLEITKRSVGYHDINDNIVIGTLAGNLVDACVDMIVKLHEINLL